MADERIEIEIFMDDGKVVKGFSNISTAAEKAGANASGSMTGASKAVANLATVAGAAGASIGGIVAAGALAKKALDFAKEGERLQQIGNQFDFLAEKAGIMGDNLKAALMGAAGGRIDDTDILVAANKAMGELGQSAAKLPDILNIARQSSNLFGGTAVENFERINQAISSGNARSLRSIGLFIDSDAAVKDYAKSLGVSVDKLTAAGRQQAVLNAVLEKGKSAFDGVKDVGQATSSVEKLTVSFDNLGDSIKVMFAESFGGKFAKWADGITAATNRAADALTEKFGKGAEQAAAKTNGLVYDITALETKIKDLRKFDSQNGNLDPMGIALLEKQLNQKKAILEQARNEEERQMMLSMKQSQAGVGAGGASSPESVGPALFEKASASELLAVQSNLLAIKQSRLSAHQELINQTMMGQMQEEELARTGQERMILLNEEYAIRANELKAQNDMNHLMTEQQLADAIANIHIEKGLRIQQIQAQEGAAMAAQAKQIGDIIKATMVKALSSAAERMGAALIKGADAFSAFGSAIFGMLGDMAIQIGTTLIAAGIGMQALQSSIVGMTGGPALFAGVALVALGGLLKALSGGGGSGGVDTGGGVAAGGSMSAPASELPDTVEEKPKSEVIVNIQGNILDRRESGSAIVEILDDYFNTSDGRTVQSRVA